MDEIVNTKKKLKILIVFNSLVGVIGGGSRHLVESLNYWNNYHDVDILISKSGYIIANEFISSDVNIKSYSSLFDKYRRSNSNSILVYISRLIMSCIYIMNSKKNYDVIVSANYQQQNMFPTLLKKLLSKNTKTKLFLYYHESSPFLGKKNFIIKIISIINWKISIYFTRNFFDRVFVVNNSTKNYLTKKGIQLDKIIHSSNAIHYNKIIEIEKEIKEYECVFLGRLVERKGVFDLIRVWKLIIKKKPLAKLCIIGEGQVRTKLENQVKNEKLDNNILFMGSVSENEKYRLLKKSKLFIYPSYKEGWGIVIAEALACELPVVTYDLPVYRKIFNNYLFTVEIGNIDKLAKKVLYTLDNLEEYNQFIIDARIYISKYDWKEVANLELKSIEHSFY